MILYISSWLIVTNFEILKFFRVFESITWTVFGWTGHSNSILKNMFFIHLLPEQKSPPPWSFTTCNHHHSLFLPSLSCCHLLPPDPLFPPNHDIINCVSHHLDLHKQTVNTSLHLAQAPSTPNSCVTSPCHLRDIVTDWSICNAKKCITNRPIYNVFVLQIV